jgi:glycosyltransferase involved in cell wall biosynthesis
MNTIACVIPAFNEEKHIRDVVKSIPDFINYIIIVNDCSTDKTCDVVLGMDDPRIILVNHEKNLGVGGAVVSGYRKSLEMGADISVKIDGDGQMDIAQIPKLINPIIKGRSDYTKGVRFRDREVIRQMPVMRLIGNLGLSFLTKIASGYWHIFDPTNGYTAISREALEEINLEKISTGYFFETDMLINLYKINAVVTDVEMKARYGDEISYLSPFKILCTFPFYLLIAFLKRIIWRYFIFDFTALSIFFISGVSLFSFGFIFGLYKWISNYINNIATPTGTIMVSVVPLFLGFQLLLECIVLDINNSPALPLRKIKDLGN